MTRLRRLAALPRAGATPSARGIFRSVAFAGLAVLLTISTAAAQGTGRITGTVTDSASGRPIQATTVTVIGTRLGAVTDAAGRYTIAAVPAGTPRLEARHLGYRPRGAAAVRVNEGQATTLDFRLAVTALSLEAVVTTGVAPSAAATERARELAPPAWPPHRATANLPASSTQTTAGSVTLSFNRGATIRTAAPVARKSTKASTSAQRSGTMWPAGPGTCS